MTLPRDCLPSWHAGRAAGFVNKCACKGTGESEYFSMPISGRLRTEDALESGEFNDEYNSEIALASLEVPSFSDVTKQTE